MSTPTTELALPSSVRPDTWNADTAAMMEFAGLTWIEGVGENAKRVFAPSGIMAGFIAACARTGLDPTTKQIYAAVMNGKWTVLVGVDGMRVVAQRSREYAGQTPMQWTRDGITWVDAWLPELQGGQAGDKPAAARVGILRRGFSEPLYQVVTWKEFGMEPRFKGDNWGVRPAHMLGIRAETHGLRRAFPNDLSGLYTAEDFDTDGVDTSDAIVGESVEPTEDWLGLIGEADDRAALDAIGERLKVSGEATDKIRAAWLARAGFLAREADTQDADVVDDTETPAGGADATPSVSPPAGQEMTQEEFEAAEAARFDAEAGEA